MNAKQQAGSKGGRATVTRHGRRHMAEIGRKGAAVFHAKYKLSPIGINDFAIVNRQTDEPGPRTLCGLDVREYGHEVTR